MNRKLISIHPVRVAEIFVIERSEIGNRSCFPAWESSERSECPEPWVLKEKAPSFRRPTPIRLSDKV